MEERFQVGVIASTHGVKGEVKVFPTTDDVQRFKKLKEVTVNTGDTETLLTIEGVKFFKQFAILKFKGIDTMEAAQCHKGMGLWVDRKDAVKLGRGEYFVADLIGLTVVDEEDAHLGELTDVIKTGANDVYAVDMGNGREVLLPAIKDCILEVDVANRRMKVHVMDGLLD